MFFNYIFYSKPVTLKTFSYKGGKSAHDMQGQGRGFMGWCFTSINARYETISMNDPRALKAN